MQGINEQVIRDVLAWLQQGEPCWLATITETWGASPRPAGSLFAYCPGKDATAGSLSGGCIEDDLLLELAEFRALARPERRLYGASAEEQARLQLPCGGRLAIVLESLQAEPALAHFEALAEVLTQRRRVMRALDLHSGAANIAESGKVQPGVAVHEEGGRLLIPLGAGERLLLLGAGEVTLYLARIAQSLDFAVTICEPRETHFARWRREHPEFDSRHCLPDDLISAEFNDPYTAVVALAHDPRVDDLGLLVALNTDAFYVGAMGSARTSAKRVERLATLGLSEAALARLSAPIGIDIGSKTPPEIAVAVAAELIAARVALRTHALQGEAIVTA